ncbi:Arc family DNA-binding protein [Pseudomonas aeruginosa]|nr:Arc family DNA-binding protein [Pseudomonas aeruginosa]KAA5635683.1 Arc family DNA-binding protein [Pseudomonas aeruginosa]KAA5662612.1 Arc family DNA-binding protein [Pseudomonas aeruginosa]RTB60226.1 Arc family DNA-binding protein [Pseudomonas aeruginosa]
MLSLHRVVTTCNLLESQMEEIMRTQVRIPRDLMEWLKQQAKEQSRSMNGQLVEVLKLVKRGQANA